MHPFFAGVDWENLCFTRSPHVPKVEHELDTQNFEDFEEQDRSKAASASRSRFSSKDPHFIGYTYKNWEAVQPDPSE